MLCSSYVKYQGGGGGRDFAEDPSVAKLPPNCIGREGEGGWWALPEGRCALYPTLARTLDWNVSIVNLLVSCYFAQRQMSDEYMYLDKWENKRQKPSIEHHVISQVDYATELKVACYPTKRVQCGSDMVYTQGKIYLALHHNALHRIQPLRCIAALVLQNTCKA